MFEGFNEVGDEGIYYGKVIEKSDKYLTITADNTSKVFLFDGDYISEGDFVRVYVKNKKVIFVEKLDEKYFKELKKLLNEILSYGDNPESESDM